MAALVPRYTAAEIRRFPEDDLRYATLFARDLLGTVSRRGPPGSLDVRAPGTPASPKRRSQ